MRPRRLSTPAISEPASGTRVILANRKTSCIRSIGRPNMWQPAVKVTYSARLSVSFIMSRCPIDLGTLLLDRGDQSGAVELGDEIVEANGTAALDGLVGNHGGESDDRHGRG